MQPVKHAQNRLFKGGSTNNTVVNDHQIVGGFHRSVSNVVNVSHQVVSAAVLSNKRSELSVFYGYLFDSGPHHEQFIELSLRQAVTFGEYLRLFKGVKPRLRLRYHA